MNKKIAMSAISIVSSLAIMGGATYAAFTDTATLTDNTFAAGTAEIQVSKTGVPAEFGGSVPGFTGTAAFYPGYSESYNFWVRNSDASTVPSLDVIAKITDVTATDEEIQDNMTVTFACTGNPVQGPFTINQWEAGEATIAVDVNSDADGVACQMDVAMPLTAPTTVQGKTLNFDVLFTGTS